MAKPVIFAIDDEPAVLHAVERDLRKKYGRDYRILKAGSGEAAIAETIAKGRNNQMPPHKDLLGPAKVHILTGYVYSLSGK